MSVSSGVPDLTFRVARERIALAQKPGAGFPAYTRWINRRLAGHVAAAAATVGLSANAVTAISAAFSLLGLAMLMVAPTVPGIGVAVAMCLATGYVLDSADGQVSRLLGTSSRAGEWLDHVVDAVRTPAIHLAVFIAWSHSPDDVVPAWLALLFVPLVAGQFMSQILAEQLGRGGDETKSGGPRVKQSLILLPIDMGVTCWLFVLWGTPAFGPAYAVLLVITAVHTAASMRRKYRKLLER